MDFGYLSQYKDYVEKYQNAKLVLFGAGIDAVELISKYFRHDDIYAIWDNQSAKWGKKLMGITVSAPESIASPNDVVVLITVRDQLAISAIQEQLKELGVDNVYTMRIMSFANDLARYNNDFSPNFHELKTFPIINYNVNKINTVYDLLADEKSRIVYNKIIEKTKYNLLDYTDICDDLHEHYFSDGIFQYSENEVIVDAGAYLGEDTIRLARIIGKGKIKRAHCFEPDEISYQRCINNLTAFFGKTEYEDFPNHHKSEKFTVYKSGLHNKNENLGFISLGSHGATFTYLGNDILENSIVPAVRLDDVINNGDKITLIKMDLEGADMAALEGAEQIIRIHKPKLAICIYHKIEDLWEIPLYIHSLAPEYKLYIRHHTTRYWDSVVYATL